MSQGRRRRATLVVLTTVVAFPGEGTARQSAPAARAEVGYAAPDGTALTATLSLPASEVPVPGVVVLSIAGTEPLVEALTVLGVAVLTPERRGFVSVEPLLRATYEVLAHDAASALEYLGGRPEVDATALALVAQADDAPPAMVTSAAMPRPVPLVLLAPPAFPGVETFRLEQRAQATRFGAAAAELDALDAYVDRIAEIALSSAAPYVREYRLQGLRAASPVELPRSAAFPDDDRQAHFFASPLWHDRLAFDPESALARLGGPVLVLIGADDADTPIRAWLEAVRRGLSGSDSTDATLCLLPGRTRHAFTPVGVWTIGAWLAARLLATGDPDGRSDAWLLECLPDPDG